MLPLEVGASREAVLSQVLTSWDSEYPGSIPSCAPPSPSKSIISSKKQTNKNMEKDHVADSSSSGWVLFLRRQRRTQIKSELFNTARRTLRVKPCSLSASSSITSSNGAGAALDTLPTPIDSVLLGWWSSSGFLRGDQVSQVMLVVKNLPANAGDAGSIRGLGRSPRVANGNPLQYSCLENSMDREAQRATVHGVAKSWTLLEHRGTIFLHLLALAFSMIGDPFPPLLNSSGPCYPPAFMLHCKNLLSCVSFPLYLNRMRNGIVLFLDPSLAACCLYRTKNIYYLMNDVDPI